MPRTMRLLFLLVIATTALWNLRSERPAEAVPVPALDQDVYGAVAGDSFTVTGLDLAGPGAYLEFSYAGNTTVVSSDDDAVESWTSSAITITFPHQVRAGTFRVQVNGVSSEPADVFVFEFAQYPLPSGTGSSEFPLTLARDAESGRIWIIEEAQTHLKWLDPATATTPARTGSIRIPQVAGDGIFAYESGGIAVRTRIAQRGEDIIVDSTGDVWFTHSGSGYAPETPGLHNVGRVVRYSPATGAFACWAAPEDYSPVGGLYVDETSGRVWYSSESSDSLWSFDPSAAPSDCLWDPYTQSWPVRCDESPQAGCHEPLFIPGYYPSVAHIARADDGALWFTHYWGTAVGRYDPADGSIIRIPLPTHIGQTYPAWFVGSGPWELSFDAEGALWVSEFFDGTLVRVDAANIRPECTALVDGENPCVEEVFVGSNGSDQRYLHSVTTDADGFVWFTFGDSIGFVAPGQAAAAIIPLTQANSSFGGILSDTATGSVWFTEFNAKRVGVLRFAAGDADGIESVVDNCPDAFNPTQTNIDRNFTDLSSFGKPFNDHTWPMSDIAGDACDADMDNDGLSNDTEISRAGCPSATVPMDPAKRDSDGDRVLDGAECALGSDPTNLASRPSTTPVGDTDGDQLSSAIELLIGTNATSRDTDGDGLFDGIEFKYYGSDPRTRDGDGDGCGDMREAGSVNTDRTINSLDMLVIASSKGPASSPSYVPDFDVNRDGVINAADLGLAASAYGFC